MKKITAVFILMFSILSCSNDDSDSRNYSAYYGKWKLTSITGSFIQAIYIVGEPQYQEFYDFKRDNTFVKTRTQNGVTTTASGTFSIVEIQKKPHFQLTYASTSTIIGSCTGNLSEELFINDAGDLTSTWRNCDGPDLVYEKTK
ncbi:hypothetical protein [Flavobacterium defluvii]|uniref:Lipocalin-like domain-containing protein n=1 Tax=Flavobacterium defluvii TaxID=370979 RepID=A0A1M5TEI4_9FLAO|nr:hypothetical protein [Flavobacterium defluvii]SHH49118.1 hypothetical protein SAMN05443663_10828 [Flavobacterium defluvii]